MVKTIKLYNARNKSERAVVRSPLYQPKYMYFLNLRDKRKGNTLQSLFTQSDCLNDDIALLVPKARTPHNLDR